MPDGATSHAGNADWREWPSDSGFCAWNETGAAGNSKLTNDFGAYQGQAYR